MSRTYRYMLFRLSHRFLFSQMNSSRSKLEMSTSATINDSPLNPPPKDSHSLDYHWSPSPRRKTSNNFDKGCINNIIVDINLRRRIKVAKYHNNTWSSKRIKDQNDRRDMSYLCKIKEGMRRISWCSFNFPLTTFCFFDSSPFKERLKRGKVLKLELAQIVA